jgi:excisionase family DNA binding protein
MDDKDLEFLSIKQTAAIIQVPSSTVRKLLRTGVIPCVTLGPHTRRIPRRALEALAKGTEVAR